MKKILTAGLVLATAFFGAFADDGIKFGGYIRTGIEGNFDSETVDTIYYNDGKYYGQGKSRLRLNLDFDKGPYGATFRYQADQFGITTAGTEAVVFLKSGNIKYAMGYAKLLDDQIIVGAGKLKDKYTSSEGFDAYNLAETSGYSSVYGVSCTYTPVKDLFFTAQVSTLYADKYDATDSKVTSGKATAGVQFNEKLLAFSAKYKNDVITVAGGYSLAGEGYGFFKYKDIEDLKFEVEAKYLSKDLSGKTDKSGDKAFSLKVSETAALKIDDIEFGVMIYETFIKDKNEYEFYPFASYKLTEVVSVACEGGIKVYEESNKDTTYSVTPSVVFNVGKANFRVFFNYDKDKKASMGSTMKVTF